MRKNWNHHAPVNVQSTPKDNTTRYVHTQVSIQMRTGRLIHPEIALEIAAWWQQDANAFAQFASTGTITPDLLAEVEECIMLWAADLSRPEPVADPDKTETDLLALKALKEYLLESSPN